MNAFVLRRLRPILRPAAVVGAVWCAAASSQAVAGPIGQHAVDADVLIQQGKSGEALDAFERASEAFWQALPLQCRTATFARWKGPRRSCRRPGK